jgi:3-oxoacyl-[acyl-carrier protein] reductase
MTQRLGEVAMLLKDKIAVVTGGSSGIGAATVRMLADEGARVAICYNKGMERAQTLLAQLPKADHRIVQLALEDSSSVRRAADEIGKAYGRADVLVNSAGFTRPIPHAQLDALDDALLDSILIANVRGPFAMIRALVPLLRIGGDGVIVNVSSISAFTGSGSNIGYCAAKAALDTMTLSLARVLGPEIRVLCVSPAAVATDFVAGRGRPQLEKIAEGTPLKRVVEPEDIARTVMACITHLKVSTGTRIIADAGRFLAT